MKQKIQNTIEVTRNSFTDDGDGVVTFANGLCISDDQTQRNGLRYDIDSLDITKYAGQLTADHKDELRNIIGRVEGVRKEDGRVVIDRIIYAVKQNPYARLAHDLLINGFSKAFSTETIGAQPSMDNVYYNHELVGLSQVVTPNNYSAVVNKLVHNSLEQAKADGLEVSGIEEEILTKIEKEKNMEDDKMKVEATPEIDETEVEATAPVEEEEKAVEQEAEVEATEVEVEEEVEETEETEVDEPEEEVEEEKVDNALDDDQVVAAIDGLSRLNDQLEQLIENIKQQDEDDKEAEEAFEEEVVEEPAEDEKEDGDIVVLEEETNAVEIEEENKEEKTEMTEEQVKNMVAEMLKGYAAKKADEPEFTETENSSEKMDWKARYTKQVNAAWDAFRAGNIAARKTLNEINEINLNSLKEAGIAKNAMTIASMGNFVIPPELYKEIAGKRTDYTAILKATEWRETDALEFAWLRRNGDIDMKNVALCDDTNNGNLKPISEYSAEPVTGKMEEVAAVTVVCTAATRYLAADLLADVAAGYRNDYDRKRAQLVIAKLEEAVNESGQEIEYAPASDTEAMIAWLQAISEVSDATTNGTLVFNSKTFAQLKAHALHAGVNGPLSHLFTDGEQPQIFGTPFVVVPNDLMPTIESDDEIAYEVGGETVEITHAVFYGDLGEFIGYTSGDLQYDISADASYENGGVVKSAYQRNELVLRGSFMRGGAIKDISRISGIKQQGQES